MVQTGFIVLHRKDWIHAEPQSCRGKKIHAEPRRRGGLCDKGPRDSENILSARFARQLFVSASPRLRVAILCVSAALRESYSRLPRARGVMGGDGAEDVVETAGFGIEFFHV